MNGGTPGPQSGPIAKERVAFRLKKSVFAGEDT